MSRLRLLRIFISILFTILIGLYLVLPAALGIAAIIPVKQTVGTPPPPFKTVSITTEDNITLAGWYAPPANSAVILLLHGAGGSREQLRFLAQLLVSHGYGVLAIDARGHGASGGKTNRLGWQGSRDVAAAVDFLHAQPNIQQIGALGLSMGGEILLGAAADNPEIVAIVADGATRRCTEELLALSSERPLVRNFTARVMFITVQILSGEKPPEPLLDSMIKAEGTRFLLIAGGAETQEVEFNKLFASAVSNRAELWIAPETPHVGAHDLYPDEYEHRAIDFFDKTLLQEVETP